jgi:iron complex transport system substrate-binding protein
MNLQNHIRLKGARLGATAALAVVLAAAGCASSGGGSGADSSGPAAGSGAHTSAAAFPQTVHGANGNVSIKQKPVAIVSLSPTATEILFAIGAGSQVKAVDKNSDYPAAAPHTQLDAYQLNPEAVAGYRPDLVIASGLTPAQVKQLSVLHAPSLVQPAASTLADTYAEIVALGRATGHADRATALVADMKRQIAAIVAATPKPAKPIPYYYELDQTYYSVTSSTFIGQLLHQLGLVSIADSAKGAAASGGYPKLNSEFILKASPAYVLLADVRCCKQSPTTVAKRPGWSALSAVQGGRVVALDDDIASRWGPRVVDLLRTVSDAMKQHPLPGTS